MLSKTPTELSYVEKSSFRKVVNSNRRWTFELGSASNQTLLWVIIEFVDKIIFNSETHDFSFVPLPITEASRGSENYPQYSINCDFDGNNYHEASYQIKNLKKVSEDRMVKPFIKHEDLENYPLYIFHLT